jgi:hypothetical protein
MNRRAVGSVLGLAAVVMLGLFLLPVVPITVGAECKNLTVPGCAPGVQSAYASAMYAYLGYGAVQVPGPYGSEHYCLVSGDWTVMCGLQMQRILPCNGPCMRGTPNTMLK